MCRTADGPKPRAQLERIKQPQRQPLKLVGANGEAVAARSELVECGLDTLEGLRMHRNVVGIVPDEIPLQPIDLAGGQLRPLVLMPRSTITRTPPPTIRRPSA